MFPESCLTHARLLLEACDARQLRLVTAESCTAGLIAACLTELAGSSRVVDRGYIVYDNRAKQEMLGVAAETLAEHGAVSERCAREMVQGALRASGAGMAIAVTGVAGPGGGTPSKPVGLVHVAAGLGTGPVLHRRHQLDGDRSMVRLASVEAALSLAISLLDAAPPTA